MRELVLVLGVVLAAFGLRTFDHPAVRKLGGVCFLVASYLAAYFLSGSEAVGLLCVAGWFFLPWLEILTRVRHLRMPLDKPLRSSFAPSAERFPQLGEMTAEVEAAGFLRSDDTSFQWDGATQFMRIFYHPGEKYQAALCLLEQGEMAITWASLSARVEDGRTWTTWNYPFAHTMMLAPETQLNSVTDVSSFADLQEAHRAFLGRSGLEPTALAEQDPEQFVETIQRETRRQVDHNLDQGLIELSGEGTFRYSWRGYLFLWRQFLRDLVRLS